MVISLFTLESSLLRFLFLSDHALYALLAFKSKLSIARSTRLIATSIQSKASFAFFASFEDFLDDFFLEDEPLLPTLNFPVPLDNAVPLASACPLPKTWPFFSKFSDCKWLKTIAFLGISTNSAPSSPTVYQCPVWGFTIISAPNSPTSFLPATGLPQLPFAYAVPSACAVPCMLWVPPLGYYLIYLFSHS